MSTGTGGGESWHVISLHHVAFAHDSDSSVREALGLLLGFGDDHEEEGTGFVERMVPIPSGCYLQLLEATGDGVVERFVSKRGSALHHLAFEVSNIDAAVTDLKGRGATLIDDSPRVGGLGTRIAFVHPASFGGLLVELVEVP